MVHALKVLPNKSSFIVVTEKGNILKCFFLKFSHLSKSNEAILEKLKKRPVVNFACFKKV